MLSNQPMSFSEMADILGVSTSFLTYHLESLGELISKTEDGKYKLSSFGEAANATMNKVEGIPKIAPHKPQITKINWLKGRSAIAALAIVCILLIAGLGGTIAYYTMAINNKQNELDSASKTIDKLNETIAKQNDSIGQLNNAISNLNSQVSSLNSQVSSLESLLNATPTTVSELVNALFYANDTSAWVNRSVALEGNLDGPLIMPADAVLPYDYELTSGNQTIGLTFSAWVNLTSFYGNYENFAVFNPTNQSASERVYFLNGSITVRIYGVVEEGEISVPALITSIFGPQVTYYVEAEMVEMT